MKGKNLIIIVLSIIILLFVLGLIYLKDKENQKTMEANQKELSEYKTKIDNLQKSYKKALRENKELLTIIKKGLYGEADSATLRLEIENMIIKLDNEMHELDSLSKTDRVTDLVEYDESKEAAFDKLIVQNKKYTEFVIKDNDEKYQKLLAEFKKLQDAFDKLEQQNDFFAEENANLKADLAKYSLNLSTAQAEINKLKKDKEDLEKKLSSTVSTADKEKLQNELNKTNESLIAAQDKIKEFQEEYKKLDTKIGDIHIEYYDGKNWIYMGYGERLKPKKIQKLRISFSTLLENEEPKLIKLKVYKNEGKLNITDCQIERGKGSYQFDVSGRGEYKIEVWNTELTEKILSNPIKITLKNGFLNWK